MTVAYNQRTTPLALNSANTAFSNNIRLAYDFTGHDSAHTAGVPWVFQGATNPTFVLTGTQPVSTVGGEPGAVAAMNSLWAYNQTPFSNASDYGLQVGSGDFTIGIRCSTPSSVPANSNAREVCRLNGSAGTALTVNVITNPSVGYYASVTGQATVLPLGATNGTPTYFPADTVFMIWVRRISGVTTVYTQNVTTQANTVVRYLAGSAASAPLDSTWVAGLRANFQGATVTGIAMQALTVWDVGHSQTTLNALGKDFYDTQTNGAVADTITITSPPTGSSIAASSVISGTYTGSAPTGVQVQHASAGWVSGTGMTIGSGAWTGSFALGAGDAGTLQARYTNTPAILSATVANITVVASSVTFTGAGATTDEAVPYRIFQRNGSNQASVRIKGAYTGAPTSLQYSFDGGAWATLVASPAGGTFNQVVTLTGPAQGALSVRFSNDTGVVGTMSAVGVGDVYMVAGQSNHVGGGAGTYVPPVAPGAHPAWVATILDKTGIWRENVETVTDPFSKTTNASFNGAASATYAVQASSATAYNSYFGKLATLIMATGVPVAFVPSAMGSTSIASWAVSTSTSSLYGAMLARATALGVTKVLWWQGEQDCTAATTRTSYEASLNALINDWCGTRFPGAKWVVMNLNVTGNTVGTGGTGGSDTGFNAIHAAIANVAATNSNVLATADMNGAFNSSIHYSTAPEIDEIAARAYAAMAAVNAPGAVLDGLGSIIGGTATGGAAGLAPGVEITGLGQIFPGSANGAAAAAGNAPGAILTGLATIVGGGASATSYARAPSGAGYSPQQRKQSRPRNIQGF